MRENPLVRLSFTGGILGVLLLGLLWITQLRKSGDLLLKVTQVSLVESRLVAGEEDDYAMLLGNSTKPRWPRITVTGQEPWMTSFQRSMVVLSDAKVVHCSIPRVGCSRWKRLLRKMEGYQDYLQQQPHTHYRNGLKHSVDLLPSVMEGILNSPKYFRFVVVRDPFSRLLSAWLAKRNHTTFPVRVHKRFANFVRNITSVVLTRRSGAVQPQTTGGRRSAPNHHFLPIVDFCGLSSIPFDFVGRYERLDEWGPLLIRRLHAEKEAATGWPPPGSFLESRRRMGSRAMNASSPSVLLTFYTPELVRLVAAAYADDIHQFGYQDFAHSLLADTEKMATAPTPAQGSAG